MVIIRRCPFCAEIIQPKAIKCKHCGERLDSGEAKRVGETEKKLRAKVPLISKFTKRCIAIILSLPLLLIVYALIFCQPTEKRIKTAVLPYKIINDKSETQTYDAPVKVMEVRRLLVQENISKEALRKVLNDMYARLRKKRGYKYSDSGPTQIGIYAHTSVDSYRQSGASWVGMLWWDEGDLTPNISFSPDYE